MIGRLVPSPLVGEADDTTENLLRRVRAEYLDMPGLRLTASQAARLFGLSSFVARRLLDTLADIGFLIPPPDGGYYHRSGSDGRRRGGADG
jgi:hypothetical protein